MGGIVDGVRCLAGLCVCWHLVSRSVPLSPHGPHYSELHFRARGTYAPSLKASHNVVQAGHDALSPHPYANSALGLLLHTFVLTPFYAWRSTHRAHHVRLPTGYFKS